MQNDFQAQQMAFAGHIRDPQQPPPEQIEDRRMAIYRRLFYNNIESFCSNAFPVLKTLLSDDDWHNMIRDFLIRHRCNAPLFNEIAREFIDYLENERDTSADLPFISQLAHYEWVELALSIANATFEQRQLSEEQALTTPLKTSPLAWPLKYDYPVYQIAVDNQPQSASSQPVFLLVYRNADDNVKFIELNPVSARLIDLLNAGQTGEQAANQIAGELQHPTPQVVIDGARQMITDWLHRGILI